MEIVSVRCALQKQPIKHVPKQTFSNLRQKNPVRPAGVWCPAASPSPHRECPLARGWIFRSIRTLASSAVAAARGNTSGSQQFLKMYQFLAPRFLSTIVLLYFFVQCALFIIVPEAWREQEMLESPSCWKRVPSPIHCRWLLSSSTPCLLRCRQRPDRSSRLPATEWLQ